MRDLDKFVREALEMSVKVGVPTGLSGVTEAIQRPEFAAAVGLMLISAENDQNQTKKKALKKPKKNKEIGVLKKFFSKF